jgi:hypothetical protein
VHIKLTWVTNPCTNVWTCGLNTLDLIAHEYMTGHQHSKNMFPLLKERKTKEMRIMVLVKGWDGYTIPWHWTCHTGWAGIAIDKSHTQHIISILENYPPLRRMVSSHKTVIKMDAQKTRSETTGSTRGIQNTVRTNPQQKPHIKLAKSMNQHKWMHRYGTMGVAPNKISNLMRNLEI